MNKGKMWLGCLASVLLASCRTVEAEEYLRGNILLASTETALYSLEEIAVPVETQPEPYMSTTWDNNDIARVLANHHYEPVSETADMAGVYGVAWPIQNQPSVSRHALLILTTEGTYSQYTYETHEIPDATTGGETSQQNSKQVLSPDGVTVSSGFVVQKGSPHYWEPRAYHLVNADAVTFFPTLNEAGVYASNMFSIIPSSRNPDNTLGKPASVIGRVAATENGLSFKGKAYETYDMVRMYGNEADVIYSVFKETGMLSAHQLAVMVEAHRSDWASELASKMIESLMPEVVYE